MNKTKDYQTRMIIILFLGFGLVFMDRFSFNYILPYILEDLNMDYSEGGLVVGILSLFFGLSTLVISSISDLMGKKKSWLIGFIFLFSFATFSAGLVNTVAIMIIVRAFMGVTEGPVIPLVQSTVIAESSDKHRGRNLGIVKGSGPLLSGVLAPMILIPIAATWGWRWAFYSLAIPGVIIAILVWKYIREPKMMTSAEDTPKFGELLKIIKYRNIWLTMILSIFCIINLSSFMAFISTYLMDTKVGFGLEEWQSSLFISVYGIGVFFWFIVIPWLSDRFGRKPTLIFFTMFACCFSLSIVTLHPSYAILLVIAFVLSFAMGYQPMFDSIIPGESIDRKYIATAMALIVLTGEVIGGTIGPIVSGYFADKYDLRAPFYICAIASVMAFLITLGVKETAPGIFQRKKNK